MSGLRFALDQLNPKLRAQAEQKMKELQVVGTERMVITPGFESANVAGWKATPRKLGSSPLLPQLSKKPSERLAFYLRAEGVTEFVREHKFHPTRKWRIDLAFVHLKLAVEIEGVTREGSRHQRIAGFRNDMRKYNELTLAGWRLLRFMPEMVSSGYAVNVIKRALHEEE